uniref:ATP synthase CF0 subunit I n=1 Tax=Eustigmatophyceae sp. Mont 10/10-1w TaxID=2506145 RepID=A0A3R5V1U6_9STRA|nr:ATP synthase CF0 subunit I [Eustigmatophyceae sp. Mont 10/10-1w]QAA11738.1 ATP synthase CF0 subunit I [Eustigmatophyceae sp. Mont 10/10-1w]
MAHESGFGLNTDILETNLINIVLLIGLLVFAFADSVRTNLKNRQDKICETLDNAANKLIVANFRYKDSVEFLEKLRKQALELQKEKIQELRKTRDISFSQFEPYVSEEIEAVKSLVFGGARSFDRELINNIFSLYDKHQTEPKLMGQNSNTNESKSFRKSSGQRRW